VGDFGVVNICQNSTVEGFLEINGSYFPCTRIALLCSKDSLNQFLLVHSLPHFA